MIRYLYFRWLALKRNVRYYDRIAGIHLKKWGKYVRLYVAAKLLKLSIKICPDLMKEYDKRTIEKHYERLYECVD